MTRTRVLRVLASVLVGAGILLAAAPAAPAAHAAAADRIERVAGGLRASPLFVDPEAAHLVPGDQAQRVRAALGGIQVPVYIAVVPLLPEDESAGDPYAFLQSVHDRVGADGVYMVADAGSERVYEENYGVPIDFSLHALEEIWSADATERPFGQRLEACVQAVAQAPPGPALRPPPREPPAPLPESTDAPPATGMAFWVGALAAGPLTVLVLSGVALVTGTVAGGVKERRTRSKGARAEAPTQPRTGHLRRLAEAELASLRDALAGAEQHPGWPRAMTSYDAGATLLVERKEAIDLLGVIVLARSGRSALRDRQGNPRRPCYINPLHGPARHERVVGLLGQEPSPVPVCGPCFDASRRPGWLDGHVLLLNDRGSRQPYYLVEGLWGDGSTLIAHDLPDRVLSHLGAHRTARP